MAFRKWMVRWIPRGRIGVLDAVRPVEVNGRLGPSTHIPSWSEVIPEVIPEVISEVTPEVTPEVMCDANLQNFTGMLGEWARRRHWDWTAQRVQHALTRLTPQAQSAGGRLKVSHIDWLTADDCGLGGSLGGSLVEAGGSKDRGMRQRVAFVHAAAHNFHLAREVAHRLQDSRTTMRMSTRGGETIHVTARASVGGSGPGSDPGSDPGSGLIPCPCFDSCRITEWRCFFEWAGLCGR